MPNQLPAFEECPQAWIEERDIEELSFEKTTWIPLVVEKVEILQGRFGIVGHRKAYRDIDSLIVPLDLRSEFTDVDWQSVSRNWPSTRLAVCKEGVAAAYHHLLGQPKSCIKWFAQDTGEVGPASNQMLHFGINRLGLVNVLGYKMGQLPEWVQKMWVTHNVSPDGGLSEELHMSQNLARPANTAAPESILWHNLQLLQKRTALVYGQPLLQQMPPDSEFFRLLNRFYCDSFEDVCELCKELHRIACEPIDIGLLNSKIDPANAEAANKQKLRQIKRLALWLNTLKLDGRKITQALAGIADLRQGDAHAKSSELRESLKLFGIPADCADYQPVCCQIIGEVANSIGAVSDAVPVKSGG